MIKQIMVIGLILLCFINNVSAAYTTNSGYFFDGNGFPEYPNSGVLWATISGTHVSASLVTCSSQIYDRDDNTVYYYAAGRGVGMDSNAGQNAKMIFRSGYSTTNWFFDNQEIFATSYTIDSDINSNTNSKFLKAYTGLKIFYQSSGSEGHVSCSMFVSPYPIIEYTLTGDTCGVENVTLYMQAGSDYTCVDYDDTLILSGDSYSFVIASNITYKVSFSDGYSETFKCDNNTIIDRDTCSYYTLNLLDDCANPLINPYTTIYRNEFIPFLLYQGYDNPIELLIGTDIELGDDIDITVHTCDGDIMLHDGCVEERVINLFHQDISWDLDITCEDDNTSAKLQGVKVIRSQDCCIIGAPSGYALTQSNGKVCFSGLANSNIDVTATKTGYADYSNTISVGNSFDCQTQGRAFTIYMNATAGESTDDYNNGTHNDSENVDGTAEETLPSEHGFGCGVYFKNTDGYIVSSIYDTDAHVDMYWWVKNHDNGDSNLKFQYQLYTHWYTAQAYTVSNNTYEYRRIYNADFNDHTNNYRGYIYNETEGCNDIQVLRVLNHTYQNESNYRNLTSHCRFMHKLGGNQIDYRSNVKIKIYANSDNSTLLNITANFMNGSTLEDSITYNWADFTNGDPKWWVVWEPDYAYTSGYNYTVNITGFDGYQLDTDEVWTADIVGSELTVFVKDNYNQQITHSTVFVEDWGSISTGAKNYVTITGFPQGTYQYKATKAGYISSGWASVDLDSHESVTCILVSETQTSITASKMTNTEIKAFFIPLMYLLLIMMLLGAFKFACGGK